MLIMRDGDIFGVSARSRGLVSNGAAMTTGAREASSSALAEKGEGSSKISLQSFKHDSHIYAAPGPATMRRTSGGRLPQKEHRACDRSIFVRYFLESLIYPGACLLFGWLTYSSYFFIRT
jgi:hypothetical protein